LTIIYKLLLLIYEGILNASEVARLLKVDRATVTRWAQQGKLKGAVRIRKSHQWRIPFSTYEELIKQQ